MTFLFTDESQKYECSDCDGFCCRNGYRITVSTGEKERLLSLEAVQDTFKKKNTAFSECSLQEGYWYLPIEGAGSERECGFLDEEKLCVIHNRHGYEAKPGICKAYPFSAREEGETEWLSYSFQCKSIRQGYGKLLSDALGNEKPYIKAQRLPDRLPRFQSGGDELSQEEFLEVWNDVRGKFHQLGSPEQAIFRHLKHIDSNFSLAAFYRSVPALFSFFWNMSVITKPVAESFSKEWFEAFERCFTKLLLNDELLEMKVLNLDFWKALQTYQEEIPFVLQSDGSEELLRRYFLHIIDRKLFLSKSPSLFLALTSLLYSWEFLKLQAKMFSIIAREDKGISKMILEQAIINSEGNFAYHKLAGESLYPEKVERKALSLLIPS